MKQLPRASALLSLLLCFGFTAGAQGVPGKTVERVAAHDSGQSYAIFLPSSYAPSRRWPLLLLLDPRGRALVPLSLFRDAAERYGYIVLSSYNTASDVADDPNTPAVNAMLDDAQRVLQIDTNRIYLAGFSGTSRMSWLFGYALRGRVAGVIGASGGPPPPAGFTADTLRHMPFAFFGTAGTDDFNHDEMRALDRTLDSLAVAHQLTVFAGGHQWMPKAIAADALRWMELQAMRTGLRARDSVLIDAAFTDRARAADALEKSGDATNALRAWRSIAHDFASLHDVRLVALSADSLRALPPVLRTLALERLLETSDAAYMQRVMKGLLTLRASTRPASAGEALERELALDSLRRVASSGDSLSRAAARRSLELVFVHTSFYEPRAYLEQQNGEHALAALRVAEKAEPGRPGVCLQRARAQALLSSEKSVLQALTCARDAHILSADVLQEHVFDRFRNSEAFRALMDSSSAPSRP
ncbi:MAG: hypothetical protein M3081_13680 [Gemmatimonadota bacterium]|nr:hypothetical protein [Gemmatimonadota bacterium]